MNNLKHIGRVKATTQKCLVVFRTLPGDAYSCLVVLTDSLPDSYHNAIINLVDSNAAQSAYEFGEVLSRTLFPDGSTMLPSLHVRGFLTKLPTDEVEMTPNAQHSIALSELNQMIAEQRGIAVHDLSIKPDDPDENATEIAQVHDITPKTENNSNTVANNTSKVAPLSDAELAQKYREDADRLQSEASNLRKLAEELAPSGKRRPGRPPSSKTDTTGHDIAQDSVLVEQADEVVV